MYEYKTILFDRNVKSDLPNLNNHARDGWRVVTALGKHELLLERPVNDLLYGNGVESGIPD